VEPDTAKRKVQTLLDLLALALATATTERLIGETRNAEAAAAIDGSLFIGVNGKMSAVC